MTDIQPVEDLLPHIMEQHRQSPKGWHVLGTPKGDLIIISPSSTFHLKFIQINPSTLTGVGVELAGRPRELDAIRQSPEYGLRPLHDSDISQIITSLQQSNDAGPVLQSIISRDPLLPQELENSDANHFLTGPILTRPDFGDLGPKLLKLRSTLDHEALERFRKNYPMRAGMFF